MKICLVCEGISATEQAHCSSCGLELVQTDEVHFPVRRGEDDAAHPLLGTLVGGKYRITNVLGKGGMGTVFRATHEVSLVPVALKILHPRFAEQDDYRRSFLAEARKAGSVIHEHSARILDVGEQADGTAYIALELVHGVTLDEWFGTGRPLAPAHVVDILHQVCQALAVAHAVGVVHRDLSPRNIMGQIRDGRPSVKILDFGIARAVRPTGASDVLPPGAFASPPYSAPEHLQGIDVDTRADLYSLGVVAFQALTGELPVEGDSRSQWIRATLEGRLRPLRAPSGTPPRLVRLVERLLSRDPERRPSTPAEVIAELEHIRRPRGQFLRGAALLLLIPSTAGFLLAHFGEQDAFLRPRPGSRLSWSTVEPAADQVAVQLRSDELRQLAFDHGGFDGRALQVTAYHRKVPLQAGAIEPILVGGGELRLSAETAAGYAAFLQTLATVREPVVLVFGVPRRAPLGYAKVLVDNEAPVVRLDARVRQAGILAGDGKLVVSVSEHGSLRDVQLTVVRAGSREVQRLPLRPTIGEVVYSARDLLGDVFPGVASVSNVKLEVRAVDEAGNESASPGEAGFAIVDLAAPGIVGLGLGDGERLIAYHPEGADFVLRLDASEDMLELSVHRPGGAVDKQVAYSGAERQLRLTLPPGREQPPFAAGAYTFELRDRAGNSSSLTTPELTFRSSAVQAQLTVEDPTGSVVVIDRSIVSDGRPSRLRLRCNSLYRPARVELRRRGGEAVPAARAELAGESMGEAWLELGALADGDYRISLTMVDLEGLRPTPASWDLIVIAGPMELRLPETGAARFLQQLLALDVVRVGGSGRLAPGFAWSLVPPKPELLRGSLWSGNPGSLKQSGLRTTPASDRTLFDEFQAVRGENVLALDLSDVLQRPLRVTVGGGDAPVLRQPDGRELREVARYFYSDTAAVSGGTDVNVEYGQPTRVLFRVRLPLRQGDDAHLLLQAQAIPCDSINSDGEGAVLAFVVPFASLTQAAGLSELSRDKFLEHADIDLAAQLRTSAGVEPITLRLHPSLSTLRPLSLRSLATSPARLPPALGAIRMTPIVGPGLGASVRDPVAADAPTRLTFRPLPNLDVHNLTQVFVQEAELTRDQYAQARQALEAAPPAARPPWQQLVHAADSLGERRLQNLLPVIHLGDEEAFATAVRLGPDRPVSGVSFFQAYTIARWIGCLLTGDPELVRLPMGLELEVGALGPAERRRAGALNGASRLTLAAHRDAAEHLDDAGAWPPTADESRRLGDVVHGVLGFDLIALDFGVREWVFDLPYVGGERARPLLEEWLRDHAIHLQRAHALASGSDLASLGDLAPQLGQLGVVRGLALGELRDLVDAVGGRRIDVAGGDLLPPTVPGVVRGLVLRRDGKGLLGELDPHLRRIGFRLAGGAAFVAAARRQ